MDSHRDHLGSDTGSLGHDCGVVCFGYGVIELTSSDRADTLDLALISYRTVVLLIGRLPAIVPVVLSTLLLHPTDFGGGDF